ncbi:hypothetical protein [Mycoplasma struthionis]|uniref:Uncharacterized protein n=1 Tax=Mycoplasma struthionis TaxID=538220 RepID=A0A3G8LH90_9MOLU|nr:hypothetical protein [Mycoplasma struthionis]AZG68707.1 hypothetical protein EGN60_01885 [Mycoplasma struthionis]
MSKISLNLIYKEFKEIKTINTHPIMNIVFEEINFYLLADSDLLINNCLIDFKNLNAPLLRSTAKAQLFGYGLFYYYLNNKSFDKIYYLNSRFNLLKELKLPK